MTTYEIVYETHGCVMAAYKNVSIVIWATELTPALVAKLDLLSEAMRQAHPEKNSTIHVIEKGTPFPNAAIREKLAQLTDQLGPRLACNATLLAGDGFWAGAMRGLITSLHWVSQRPFRARICANIEDVVSWLPEPHRELTGVRIEPEELTRVLRELTTRIA